MDRRSAILAAAQRHGRVTVDGLAGELGVSAHTIRRDLNALCEEAKLRRLHGGAEFMDGTANMPYGARSVLNYDAKRAIAETVADMVFDGATVFISIGSTPAIIARTLSRKESLTVVTNNLNAAMALSENTTNRIFLPGGEMRLPDGDFLNEASMDLFGSHQADFGIYGVGGIDKEGSLFDFHLAEVSIREQIRANSRKSVLVADKSKFGRRAAAAGGRLGDADNVVIDARPGEPYAALLEPIADRLVVAAMAEA
ncbi:DeoR/GlpR family DNA-binding transcription regulator [Hoeflea sp. WL0058]|uniref:DeoR/GlpR family DNA-binding transcription regulator n=1 Tax=Flavimaribacter sediminis TaxID=2865987 RepID=A0AAE2ZNW6_9HYPH|nr:DeoR/GlpR family DNA-binding transcription regulator [Flavimaribacter sediminis]MBW8639464.1 DeoR/GlpR family DNA-binding transcription regulator [Flavimaribacter sediminis]